MKNWKTTLAGLAVAIGQLFVSTIQQGHSLADWKTWIVPFGIACLGLIAKDFDVTGIGTNATTDPVPPKSWSR